MQTLPHCIGEGRLEIVAGEFDARKIVILGLLRRAETLPHCREFLRLGIGLRQLHNLVGWYADELFRLAVLLGQACRELQRIADVIALVLPEAECLGVGTGVPGFCACGSRGCRITTSCPGTST